MARLIAPLLRDSTPLPAQQSVEQSCSRAAEPLAARGSVLVVDDDYCLRELLDIHLCNAGYDVRTAEDAVVAGRLVLQRIPDLIILDVNMPFMNGYEFAAALKADPRTASIPVAFLTSDDDPGDYARGLSAVAYLKKPVLADRLIELVALYMPHS